MAKRTETVVTLVDDLDGSKADRTVSFTIDGTSYEIELSKKNASAFEKVVAPYVNVARKIRTNTRSRATSTAAKSARRPDLGDIRAWAQMNGHEVSDRGRVSATVMEAYDAVY